MAVEPRRGGVWFVGVGEYSEPLETSIADELGQLFKLCIGLTRKAGDECGPHREVRDRRTQLADQLFDVLPADAALHAPEHAVVDVLERQVEIRHDLRGAGQ